MFARTVLREEAWLGFCAILFGEMQARNLMKTHVVKTTPEASLGEAVDLMDIYQVDSMPVVNSEGRLCGVIAETDIIENVFGKPAPERPAQQDSDSHLPRLDSADAATRCVSAAMQGHVLSVSEDGDVETVARLLFVNDYTRLPVTNEFSEVVGTLNRIDILQAIFERTLAGI